MTPQEAANLAITLTAAGRGGSPLWSFLPGMFIESTLDVAHPDHHEPGRVLHVARGAPVLGVCDVDGELIEVDARFARPDFIDRLTVQALYLLVVRAYLAAGGYLIRLDRNDGTVQLRTRCAGGMPGCVDEGPDYAVFTRALAAAPT